MANFSRVSDANKEKLITSFTAKKKFDPIDIKLYTSTQKEHLMSIADIEELKKILEIGKVPNKPTPIKVPVLPPTTSEDSYEVGWNQLKNLTDLIKNEKPAMKIEIMKNFNLCDKAKELLQMTYSPLVTYGIQPDLVKKNLSKMKGHENKAEGISIENMVDTLKSLSERSNTGNEALVSCLYCTVVDPFFLLLLGKDLQVRIGVATINKVFPGLIPVYPVQLINTTWVPGMKAPLEAPRWMIDRKLDGERGTLIIKDGRVSFNNRTGVHIPSMTYFCTEFRKVLVDKELDSLNIVIDGEIVKMINGVETFQGLEREIRKVNYQMKDVKFIAFDVISTEVFFEGEVSAPLFKRREMLTKLIQALDVPHMIEEAVILWMGDKFPEDSVVQKHIQDVVSLKGEGVVLKADIPYKGVRHSGLIRCKTVSCEDFECVSIKKSDQMMPGSTTKKSVLSAITVKLDTGDFVDVGSGFTWKQREDFAENPETIIGFPIEVQYSIRTKNLEGGTSLRFPVFRKVHPRWDG